MTGQISSRRFNGALAFSGVAVAVLMNGVVASAQTSEASSPPPVATTHLDFTLDTGTATVPTADSSKSTAAEAARYEAALASRSASPSRDSFRGAPSAAPQVLAQLGAVTSNVAQIRIARDAHSRLLSTVAVGTNLAVVADGGAYWGVLMINKTMGWIPKASMQLMDYRANVAAPVEAQAPAPTASEPTVSAAASVGSSYASAVSNLDPRTTSLLQEAFSYLGVPYVWAGNTRRGLDCSGFVCNVFGAMGVHLPRHSGDQARVGQQVHGDDLRPGDRLYFDMGNKGEISHCGIYVGNGYFIHASTNHGQVAVDSLLKPNYRRALVCACRS